MYDGGAINMNYWKRQRARKEAEKRVMEDWIPWTLIKIKPFERALEEYVFLLRPFAFDPKKFHPSYRQYKWEIVWIISDGLYTYYHEPVFKNVLMQYTANQGKRVQISESIWNDLCTSQPAKERYDKIATMFENGTALSYDQSHYGRLTNNNHSPNNNHVKHSHHSSSFSNLFNNHSPNNNRLTNNNHLTIPFNNHSPNNNRVKQSRHGSSFSNNISYDVDGRLSASRIKSFLPSSMTPMGDLSVDDLTKRYTNLIKAYKHIRDDVPADLPDITIHAMARGNIYENCALFYLYKREWRLQHERFFSTVTDMRYQPYYKETREDSYQPSPEKELSGQKMSIAVQTGLNWIRELGLYERFPEQKETISPNKKVTEEFDKLYETKYTYTTMDETCFGKGIPVLPDALCMFRGQKTVVEVKCPTKPYTISTYRGFIPQMTLEMYAYGCSQCLFVEYVTDTYKKDGGKSSVRVRLLEYNKDIMDQLRVCFRALDLFSLSMQHHKKVKNDLPNDFDVTNPEHYDNWKDHEHFEALKESLRHLCKTFEILNDFCQKEAERYNNRWLQDYSEYIRQEEYKRNKEEAQKRKTKNALKARPYRKRRTSYVLNNNRASKRPKESYDLKKHLHDTFDKLSIRF